MIGNWFVLWRREELKTLGHQRSQFVTIGGNVVQHVLDCLAKLRKAGVVAIACHFALQKLPEPLDQVQIG